jgi:hypothetical protein
MHATPSNAGSSARNSIAEIGAVHLEACITTLLDSEID